MLEKSADIFKIIFFKKILFWNFTAVKGEEVFCAKISYVFQHFKNYFSFSDMTIHWSTSISA